MNTDARCRALHCRTGFTALETVTALFMMLVVLTVVAQLSYWSVRQRARIAARHAAIECAANVLETAAACPWESLDADWAAGQRVPPELEDVLPEATLEVTVHADASQPAIKRVVVQLRWLLPEDVMSQPVRLESLFAARAAERAGGEMQ